MKTRLLFVFMLFVAMIVDAEEVTDYGFMIEGNRINSSNYQSLSNGQAWSYDPTTNVLHLKDGTVGYVGGADGSGSVLAIYGDDNSTLNIQVDGDCKMRGVFLHAIRFFGNGTHTISGSGVLDIESSYVSPKCIQSEDGTTDLTIRDITMNIRAYGPSAIGFFSIDFSNVLLDHCEININSGWAAWVGNGYTVNPVMKSCYLVDGRFIQGGIISNTDTSLLSEISIKRFETISQLNITVQKPVYGAAVNNNTSVDNTHVLVENFEWHKSYNNKNFDLVDEDVFEEGCTYMAFIGLKTVSRDWRFAEIIDLTINGRHLTMENEGTDSLTYIWYAFNTFNLMVDGVQVTWFNKDDILGTRFNPSTNTLTLDNFNIDTQMEYEWCVNNNNDMSTFDYDFDVKDLTIKVYDSNTIRTDEPCLYLKGVNLTITGSGELNLTSHNGNAIDVTNGSLTLAEANVYAKGKTSAIRGNGSEMTVNHSSLEALSAEETQATIRGFTSFQMTDSFFEDVYDDHDQIFYSDYMYYDNSGYYIYYDGVYGIDEGFDQSYYDNPYVGKVIISPAKSSITTNINEVYGQRESVKGQRDERYNLSGQRVGKDYKGIVIINGKKTVVK